MSILTGRDLEFLDSLRTSWSRLYWNELTRLRKEEDRRRNAQLEVRAKGRQSGLDGKILAFARPCPNDMTSE